MHQADVCNPRFKDEYPFHSAVPLRSGLLPRAANRALHFTRSASPSVVPPQRALSAHCAGRRDACALSGSSPPRPPARLWHPCRVPRGAGFRAHARAVARRRPRPRPPRLRERAVTCSTRDAFHRRETLLGLGSGPTTLPPWSVAWRPFARRGRPLRASRPSARPAATGLAFERQMPLADFCNCKEYEHTGERPIPASSRARDRLVSLRLASCPAKRAQAMRQDGTEAPLAPKRRRIDREHVESASALRRIGRLVEPRTPRGHRAAGSNAMESPGSGSARSRSPSYLRPAKGACTRATEVPSTARETDVASWAPPLRPPSPGHPEGCPAFRRSRLCCRPLQLALTGLPPRLGSAAAPRSVSSSRS